MGDREWQCHHGNRKVRRKSKFKEEQLGKELKFWGKLCTLAKHLKF
jgi:hypothetical protein